MDLDVLIKRELQVEVEEESEEMSKEYISTSLSKDIIFSSTVQEDQISMTSLETTMRA